MGLILFFRSDSSSFVQVALRWQTVLFFLEIAMPTNIDVRVRPSLVSFLAGHGRRGLPAVH